MNRRHSKDDSDSDDATFRSSRDKKNRNVREDDMRAGLSSDEEIASHEMEEDDVEAVEKQVGVLELDLSNMRDFISKPLKKDNDIVECYIERNRSGKNRLYPEYCLYLKQGDKFILTAKKRPKNKTSNYLISMQRGDLSRTSSNYMGKLRSNFLGTEFVVYDDGENTDQGNIDIGQARSELAGILFQANILGSRGPRKLRVCVPRVKDNGKRISLKAQGKDSEIIAKCKMEDHTQLTYLINKPPRWNDDVSAYVLNFNGRVTMASVKNFQLVTPDDQDTVVLQFGRVGKDLFTMDFRYPLCPLQAFGVTLSSFDSKLICE